MFGKWGPFLQIVLVGVALPVSRAKKTEDFSIMELINVEHVQKLLEDRKRNLSSLEKQPRQNYYYKNEIEELQTNVNVKNNMSDNKSNCKNVPVKISSKSDLLKGMNGRKMLKSSKNALLVTKKEYLQKDWCKTEPLIQRIKEPGCLAKNIINKFCYGQCNSFYIPISSNEEEKVPKESAFKSCSFCKPRRTVWVTVLLRCPQKVPLYKKKRVEKIKQCKCVGIEAN
ncbi:gremlin-1-like [Agrilus planipennis]|uniref:Gremlin-1-like n=1 Tax=Agrilus planipennis TaxID=224129 RepID=A0A1W4XBT8_AGRPL|nr:gremlin-1-like [Agrilus planipennis]